MQQIHHKRNELLEVEFFKDKECTEAFDFTNAKNLYIELKYGDCTPIFALSHKLSGLNIKAIIFTPIWQLGWYDGISPQTPVVTLNDVLCCDELKNITLSKYIPEDNAVLFLSEEDTKQYISSLPQKHCSKFIKYDEFLESEWIVNRFNKGVDITTKPITIFLPHGTQSELEKANEVAKELKEKYGVEEVNLFVLHWFCTKPNCYWYDDDIMNGRKRSQKDCYLTFCEWNRADEALSIDNIITTNSTGILKPEDSNKRLQVIDAKEIFEEYLKTQR